MNAWWHETIGKHLIASAEVMQITAKRCVNEIDAAARLIAESLSQGGKILLCGNGGSAADCQHIAAEFVNSLTKDVLRPALAAIALTTDISIITARANDYGFDTIFARQVEALGRPGDVLLGISTSGTSDNVIKALQQAQALGIQTIALTGTPAGPLAEVADIVICVPSACTQHIQEAHMAIGHALCAVVENIIYKQEGSIDHNQNALTN